MVFGGNPVMRGEKRKDKAPASRDPNRSAWIDELLADAFEVWLGTSRLLTALQCGPPSPPRRTKRPARRKAV
jgi:hypothetical protein